MNIKYSKIKANKITYIQNNKTNKSNKGYSSISTRTACIV